MKKTLLVGLLLLGTVRGWAYSIGDFLNDVDKQISFTALDSIQGAYFYNTVQGRSEIGVVTHAINLFKYLNGDIAYTTGYDDKTMGAFKYGLSLNGKNILSDFFPETVAKFKAFLPGSANKILDAAFVGPYVCRNSETNNVEGGFYSGLTIHW